MQRLFSTFPDGLPGAGLLLLRAAVAIPVLHAGLLTATPPSPMIADVVAGAAAVLLLIGLWTPIAGIVIALIQLGLAWSHSADSSTSLHLAVLAAALAMLGPGRWSADARIFGRKQIQIPQR